ncbi:WD40 repeat domain-containing protein, partial [Streptomyces sp. UH6]|uniref:WD40 repeat domain-containing protein n=1 Tax=Streptomyces sp. UH6 TaxID=2748379 RepID=UPI0015D52005
DLLHGTTLRTSLDWLATAPFPLRPSPLELRFLTASRTAATRAARRRRQLLTGLAVLTVLALLAGTFAWFQREESRRRGEEADLRRAQATARSVAQAADSLRGTAPDTALLLGLASWRIAHTAESRAALNTAATQRETSVITLPVPANAPENGTVLLDRGRSMMIYTTERATFWDLTKGQKGADKPRLTLPGLASVTPYTPPVVSQDGRLLVLPGRTKGAPYRLVSTRDGSPVGKPVPLQPGFVPAQVSNEGHVLFDDDVNGLGSRRHRLLSPSRATTAEWTGGVATLSPRGTHYASCGESAEGPLEVWSIGPGAPRRVFDTEAPGVTCGSVFLDFGADGDRIGMRTEYGTAHAWSLDGRPVGDAPGGGAESRTTLTEDGAYFLTVTEENAVEVRRVDSTAEPLFRFSGRSSKEGYEHVALDTRTNTLTYATEAPHQVHRLDLTAVLSGHEQDHDVTGGAVSPDGRVGVFRKGEEQPVQHLVDLRTGKETAAPVPQRMAGDAPSVNRFSALSTGGRVLAFTDHRPRGDELGLAVSVWDTRAHKELFRASVPEGKEVFHLALSPDGRHVAVSYDFRAEPSGEGGTTDVWDVRTRRRVHTFEKATGRSAFSADSRRLVTTDGDVLELSDGAVRRAGFSADTGIGLAFSADGKTLAVVTDTGWTELWDSAARRRLVRMPSPTVRGGTHAGEFLEAPVFSHDGALLAAVVDDDSVQLWDVEAHLALGDPLELTGREIDAMAFDGADVLRVLTGSRRETLDLTPGRLAATVCRKAGRDITPQEWDTYVPDAPYRPLC